MVPKQSSSDPKDFGLELLRMSREVGRPLCFCPAKKACSLSGQQPKLFRASIKDRAPKLWLLGLRGFWVMPWQCLGCSVAPQVKVRALVAASAAFDLFSSCRWSDNCLDGIMWEFGTIWVPYSGPHADTARPNKKPRLAVTGPVCAGVSGCT